MKKNLYNILFAVGTVLLLTPSVTFAKNTALSKTLCQSLPLKIEQGYQEQQLVRFFENIAQQDPAAFATLLLGDKFMYVSNPEVTYIGIKPNGEVFVISKIDDFEDGTFYHTLHKKDGKVSTQSVVAPAAPQEFITLFRRTF